MYFPLSAVLDHVHNVLSDYRKDVSFPPPLRDEL